MPPQTSSPILHVTIPNDLAHAGLSYLRFPIGKTKSDDAGCGVGSRIGVMLGTLIVSLFAVAFPTISKKLPALRIPRIVFFIGKHFGTGVILSTAFCHLLQEAFEALLDPRVKARWNTGRWVGLIILVSLLSIFFVEYICTSYVDRLHSTPSAPPSPKLSAQAKPITQPITLTTASSLNSEPDICDAQKITQHLNHGIRDVEEPGSQSISTTVTESTPTDRTPLLRPKLSSTRRTSHRNGATHHHSHSYSHSPLRSCRSQNHQAHTHTHSSSDEQPFFVGHHRHERRESHLAHHERGPKTPALFGPEEGFGEGIGSAVQGRVKPQRRRSSRQEDGSGIGDGLDVHVHAGGYTHTHNGHGHGHGADGLWESDPYNDDGEESSSIIGSSLDEHSEGIKIGKKRQVVGILVLQLGIMIHSLVIGLTLAITSGPEFASLVTAIIFHQLFEGLSLGVRIAALPSTTATTTALTSTNGAGADGGFRLPLLKPILCVLFAVTTPVGVAIGVGALGGGNGGGGDEATLLLTRGLMCAISSGMLIYAACVEMLAGDFVMDPTLWRGGVGRQVVALGSLVVGVGVMAGVGA